MMNRGEKKKPKKRDEMGSPYPGGGEIFSSSFLCVPRQSHCVESLRPQDLMTGLTPGWNALYSVHIIRCLRAFASDQGRACPRTKVKKRKDQQGKSE